MRRAGTEGAPTPQTRRDKPGRENPGGAPNDAAVGEAGPDSATRAVEAAPGIGRRGRRAKGGETTER